jgi:hypothetical protein
MINKNVRISKKGRSIINNHELAHKLVLAVTSKKREMISGKPIHIDGLKVTLVTTHPDTKEK